MMEWDGLNPLFQQGVFYAHNWLVFGKNIRLVLNAGGAALCFN
jgi:hypothetical protein